MADTFVDPEPALTARHQAALSEFARFALGARDLAPLVDEAARVVARALEADCSAVLELPAAGGRLLLRAGVGWWGEAVGVVTVSAGSESPAGSALQAAALVLVGDLRTDARFPPPSPLHEQGIVSSISAPVRGSGTPFGVIEAHMRRRRDFTPGDSLFVRSMAYLLRTAVDRLRATEAARALAEVGRELTAILNPQAVVERVAGAALGLLRARRSALYRLDPATGDLVCIAAAGPADAGEWIGGRLPPGTGLAAQALSAGHPVWCADLDARPDLLVPEWAVERVHAEGFTALAAAPLSVSGWALGGLVVADVTGRQYTDTELQLLSAFASQAAVAMENARLFDEATRRGREAQELAWLARALTESLDVQAVGGRIVASVLPLFRVRLASLRVLEADGSLRLLSRLGAGIEPLEVLPPGTAPAVHAVAQRAPFRTADVLHDPRIPLSDEHRRSLETSGVGAVLSVPLSVKGTVIGTLTVEDQAGREFADDEVALLEAFAGQAAVALENARLFEAAERRREEMEVLAEIARAVNSSLDLDTVLLRIAAGARELTRSDLARIALRVPGEDAARFRYGVGSRTREMQALRVEAGHGIGGRVLATGKPFRTADYAGDSRFSKEYLREVQDEGIVATLSVPIHIDGRVEGLLHVDNREPYPFSDRDEAVLVQLAHHAAVAIRNAQLFARERTARAEAEASGRRYSDLVEGLDAVLWEWDAEKEGFLFVSGRIEALLGYPVKRWLEDRGVWTRHLHPEDREQTIALVRTAQAEGRDYSVEYRFATADGRVLWLRDQVQMVRESGRTGRIFRGLTVDVTERKALEAQLRQAQKMEAVGKLAGGVAHDFNNLLTIIAGRADLVLEQLPAGHALRRDVELVLKTAERAAALVAQLLAFSRKQILQPQVLDLNQVVAAMGSMLRRLIGEDIELVTVSGPDLGRVRADPSQLEQVVVNLAVNARDAMPRGGRLIIETANVELDETYVRRHPGSQPGPHVMLAVSDTGIGIDAATQARIFDPFFTTKEQGKGTGLGLATVYGIVKQSSGNIWVYSEPGRGSTFKIYLPRLEEPAASATGIARDRPTRGSETILLVEDEDEVRGLARDACLRYGYTVLEALTPEEALTIGRSHRGPLQLLVTDVVMPGLSGRELATQLIRLRPGLRVLFISGYTDDAVVRSRALPMPSAFLQKPFSPALLARKVREVLDT